MSNLVDFTTLSDDDIRNTLGCWATGYVIKEVNNSYFGEFACWNTPDGNPATMVTSSHSSQRGVLEEMYGTAYTVATFECGLLTPSDTGY